MAIKWDGNKIVAVKNRGKLDELNMLTRLILDLRWVTTWDMNKGKRRLNGAVRIVAKGRTYADCKMIVENKVQRGWAPISEIKLDSSYISVRYVCVLEKTDQTGFNKSKFNQYMGI